MLIIAISPDTQQITVPLSALQFPPNVLAHNLYTGSDSQVSDSISVSIAGHDSYFVVLNRQDSK